MDIGRLVNSCGFEAPKKSYKQDLKVEDFMKAKKALAAAHIKGPCNIVCTSPCAPSPMIKYNCNPYGIGYQEEGITPMKNYTDNCATASVTGARPDTQIQREYLGERLAQTYRQLDYKLEEQFHLHVCNEPKNAKDLVAAITGGKFKLASKLDDPEYADEIKYSGPFWGIDFDGPQPDRKGFDQARKDLKEAMTKVKDIIVIKDADAGLAAVEAFAAWLPTGLAN